ncbi:hypothetical protein BH09SUM1_BH09SUM1_27240 [soil metagenome]
MKLHKLCIALTLAAMALTGAASTAPMSQEPMDVTAQTSRAPELEPNEGWLNTDKPLRFSEELKGQIVVLDFWTYACINCMHILPDLAYLEEKYKNDPVVIIGVHSAKFENEASRETIRAAIGRYEIKHPVVIDKEMAIWQAFGASGWPTFVVIDAKGDAIGQSSGEGNRELLDETIARLLKEGREDGSLAKAPLKINREGAIAQTGVLAYPGKVLADPVGKRLFISDSNHNRIIVASLPDAEGRSTLIDIVGSGAQGMANGDFATATFHHPQGLASGGDMLYVADTENHEVRSVDLTAKKVKKVVGTGMQGSDREGGAIGSSQEINSPWDLYLDGDQLLIAMAGTHQIWVYDVVSQVAERIVGSGRENIVDGKLREAAMAQPSGITMLNRKYYSADSETSSIREIDLKSKTVKTVTGKGLFEFGDADGGFGTAKLQHPLGIAADGDSLLVADTYNHKIKRLHLTKKTVTTLYGRGKPATSDGEKPAFFEPAGLSVANGKLYVADTDNHRIVQIDMTSGAWHEVMIDGLKEPAQKREEKNLIAVAPVTAPESGAMKWSFNLKLPEGMHANAEAPMQIRLVDGDKPLAQKTIKSKTLPVTVEVDAAVLPAEGTVRAIWTMAYCSEGDEAQCFPGRFAWDVPVRKGRGGKSEVALESVVEPKKK